MYIYHEIRRVSPKRTARRNAANLVYVEDTTVTRVNPNPFD